MIDFVSLILLQSFIYALNLVPYRARCWLLTQIIRVFFVIVPTYRQIAMRNLTLAFPDKSDAERADIFRRNSASLARLFVDAARLHTLSADWIKKHVEFPNEAEIRKLLTGRAVVVASGHLGSFELMGQAAASYGFPLSYVVRNFKLPRVDAWWRAQRERLGNRVIDRKGAVRAALREVRAGRITVFLFDQNVTRNHAVFVDLFGRPAATTRAVGLVALETRAQVLVVSITTLGIDKYRLEVERCDCEDIYDSKEMSIDEKIKAITERATKFYEAMIRKNPDEWFWIHRRWKTVAEGEAGDFYA